MEQDKNKKRRIAINGFGRIGRAAFKIALKKETIEVVAINDLTDPKMLAYLLEHDTVYGRYHEPVSASDKKPVKHDDCKGSIEVHGKLYPILSQKEPEKLPWKSLGVDVVIESTGFFTKHEDAKRHLTAGAKRVVISAPAKDKETQTHVIGVNTAQKVSSEIVSNASCTTNSIAPVIAVIHKAFGVEKALMTTIHSYTSTQNLVDGPSKDLRRARAAAQNIIPTSTGAAIATTKVIPELENKFDGMSVRVPTIAGSLSDITMLLKKNASKEDINKALTEAATKPPFKGVIQVSHDPFVSSDIIGNAHSAVVDLEFTNVVGGNLAKVLAWYDNEWGYANRLVEMAETLSIA